MTDHEHTLAGAELEKVLLDVFMSGFKSGVGTAVATILSRSQVPDALRDVLSAQMATEASSQAFEDPAFRETALEACRASVMNHFHPDSAGNRVWHLKLGRKG